MRSRFLLFVYEAKIRFTRDFDFLGSDLLGRRAGILGGSEEVVALKLFGPDDLHVGRRLLQIGGIELVSMPREPVIVLGVRLP